MDQELSDLMDLSPDWLAFEASRKSFRAYLQMTVVNSLPRPRPFGEISEPWQWNDMFNPAFIKAVESMIASEEEAIRSPYTGPHSFWRTFPRGSDKTSALARTVNHLLIFGRRSVPLKISVAAADKRQAKFLRDAMLVEKSLNPWFGKHLEINQYDAKGPSGELVILSADAGGAFGAGDDVIICDELTHWPSQDLFVALFSGRIKRQSNITIIITNAGYKGTWQWEALNNAKSNPKWDVYDKPGYKSGWVTKDMLKETRDFIIRTTGNVHEAMRLLDNLWISSKAGACFLPEDIEAMETIDADEPILI